MTLFSVLGGYSLYINYIKYQQEKNKREKERAERRESDKERDELRERRLKIKYSYTDPLSICVQQLDRLLSTLEKKIDSASKKIIDINQALDTLDNKDKVENKYPIRRQAYRKQLNEIEQNYNILNERYYKEIFQDKTLIEQRIKTIKSRKYGWGYPLTVWDHWITEAGDILLRSQREEKSIKKRIDFLDNLDELLKKISIFSEMV